MKFISIIDDNNKLKNKTIANINKISKMQNFSIDFYDLSNIDNLDIKKIKNNNYDIMLAIGGDGTIIRAAKLASILKLNIAGINIGHIGFLSSIQDLKDFNSFFVEIKNKNYKIINRNFLEIKSFVDNKLIDKCLVLNDIILKNLNPGSMSKYQIFDNKTKQLINNYHSDGLIFSTPTGSTAYSFSANGPIITPYVKCILITPICPHAFNTRSIVVDDNYDILVIIESQEQFVCFDGRNNIKLNKNDSINIKKSKKSVDFIVMNNYNFFDNLDKRINNI